MLHRIRMNSPFGIICIEDDGEALTALYLENARENPGGTREEPGGEERDPEKDGGESEDMGKNLEDSGLLTRAEAELQEYFAGKRKSFDLPLHPPGTEFQKQVWEALQKIPYGETRTYGEVAQAIGRPKACRAVGGANNKNPIMLFIPCHRVIGSDGSLTGFAGGLDMKRRLLEMEAANRAVSRENGDEDCENPGGTKDENCQVSGEVKESDCEAAGKTKSACRKESEGTKIRETQPLYACGKNQASLEDYYALPDDRRAELIDGVFYDMAAPSLAHQGAAAELYGRLRNYIVSQKGSCYPLISPFDVQLDCDEKTMVQPDVAVVCDRSKLRNRCVFGAPDLVIEILSDSSIKRDCVLKLAKYMAAGVREYWIVDLEGRRVLVYESGREVRLLVYGMDSLIPVGIFDGNCKIDFSEIYQWIRFLMTE